MIEENLIPKIGVITDVRKDTPDVKTFRVVGTDGKKLFKHLLLNVGTFRVHYDCEHKLQAI